MRRLSEKTTAVHVLMCASAEDHRDLVVPLVSEVAPDDFELSPTRTNAIVRLRVAASYSAGGYSASCLEAAYRLIESSPTLRREWFGAK